MNIIKLLMCRIKVRAVGLGMEDFIALCEMFDCKKSKLAAGTLRSFFGSHTPDENQLSRVYGGSDDLMELYLNSIKRNRRLTEYEQKGLIERMPMSRFSRFPSALDKKYLERLFEKDKLSKLIAYVRDFILPPDLEHRLIDAYANEGEIKAFDSSYRMALNTYLLSAQKNKFQTPAVQLSLLALNNEDMLLNLLENCSMDNNILFIPTMKQLVESGSKNVLNKLLLHTFVASDESYRRILERFPDLRWAAEISRLRKPLRKLEREAGDFWGVLAPSMREYKFIMKTVESDDLLEAHYVVPKMLAEEDVTPYFCAWVASEYPEHAQTAYRVMRKTAEKYRDRYKKSKK